MIPYVQVGDVWVNTAQVRCVRLVTMADGSQRCRVEFDREHVLDFEDDDAKAIHGYLQYHMTTYPGPTTMPR